MTHPEDLKPGDWVVVVSHKCKDCGLDHQSHFGEPHQVIAISLPFLLLKLNGEGNSSKGLDVREYDVQRVGTLRKPGVYVCCWMQTNHPEICQDTQNHDPSDDHRRCVRCGERLRQVSTGLRLGWRWLCPQCGADGGLVESDP